MTKFGDPQNWISVCVSIGVLLVVSAVAFVYFCARRSSTPVVAPGRHDVEIGGIDESTLDAYPTVTYREARKQRQAAAEQSEGCTVCLERYGDGDVVRVLPDCGHLFHRECVDPWLRKRSTCPVCRTSPLPSPMPTPLAEVTPLALARPS